MLEQVFLSLPMPGAQWSIEPSGGAETPKFTSGFGEELTPYFYLLNILSQQTATFDQTLFPKSVLIFQI